MNFKPNDFFIGLVDFITILLPGAALALIMLLVEFKHPIQDNHFLYQYAFAEDSKILFWFSFILTSFGLGYFLSSIASGLDGLYDAIRFHVYPYEEGLNRKFKFKSLTDKQRSKYKAAYEQYRAKEKKWIEEEELPGSEIDEDEKLLKGYKIIFRKNILRRLALFFFELEFEIKVEKSYEEVRKIMNSQPDAVRNAINAYKWAGIVLEAHFPTISEQATRIMAASKFFRSIVIVMLVYIVLQIFRQVPSDYWLVNVIVLLLSFREYIVQRHKSVQKTYQSLVTLSYYEKKAEEKLPEK